MARLRRMPASGRSRWAASASSMAISAPARSMRCVKRSSPPPARITRNWRRETPCSASLSLILWALFIIVTLKYVVILLRADNNGEGGTLTLMALASRAVGRFSKAAGVGRAARHHQRGFVLRRCRHHAGVVGAVRRRGSRRRNAGIPCLRRAADDRDPAGAVCLPVARHREGGGAVRSDHGGLVRGDRHTRPDLDRRRSRRAVGFNPYLRRLSS